MNNKGTYILTHIRGIIHIGIISPDIDFEPLASSNFL